MIEIIDIVDAGRIDEQLFIIPSKIDRVLLVRAEDHNGGVYAFGILRDKKKHDSGRPPKAVLFELGRMNFNGGAGGQNYLDEFRKWLDSEGLLGKIDPKLCHTEVGVYDRSFDDEEFDPGVCRGPMNSDAEEAERRFAAWLRGAPDWRRL